jgi:hypothetical protein
MVSVLFVFHRNKHLKYCAKPGLREIFGLKTEGVAGTTREMNWRN